MKISKKTFMMPLFILTIMFVNVMVLHAGNYTKSSGYITSDTDDTGTGTYEGVRMYYKTINNTPAYCVSGITKSAPSNGATCTELTGDNIEVLVARTSGETTESLSEADRARLGQIIASGYANTKTSYLKTEMAILHILDAREEYDDENNGGSHPSSSLKTEYINIAQSVNTIYNSQISLSTTELTFTRSGENYISQSGLKVNNSSSVSAMRITDVNGNEITGAKMVGSYDNFYIQVPASSINTTTKIVVTVDQKPYSTVKVYSCDSGNQNLVTYDTVSKSLKMEGSITPNITINKVDQDGKTLAGATLNLCKDKECKNIVDTWTEASHILDSTKVVDGTYYLKETTSPDGYNVIKDVVTLTIENGAIKTNTSTVLSYEIKNTLTETVISKKAAATSEELPGATLKVLDKDKKDMSCTMVTEKDGKLVKEKLDVCSWISGDKPVTILGLSKGKYHLQEKIAPEGFVISDETIEFEVLANGEVTNVEMVNETEVPVPDTLSSRSALLLAFAMFDIALGVGIITYVKKNKIEE